jgi:tripartite-type tricarboxylate transporter receptor subunit TctC
MKIETSARRRALVALASLVSSAIALPTAAQGSAWPAKPVRLVVPFPPGGGTDTMARVFAQKLSELWGQNVLVENRGGANGNIGTEQVAKAAPDGNTLVMSGVGTHMINASLYRKLAYHPVRDFTHIALIATGPNLLIANPAFPIGSVQELVRYARSNPGKLSFASGGSGSSGHLAMEMLKAKAGVFMVHVPYRGGGPAITDVISGQIPMMFTNLEVVLDHVKAGRLKALAVSSPQRNPAAPDVPTVAEAGFPGFSAVSWYGISGPSGMPPAVVEKIHGDVMKVLTLPDVRGRLLSQGFELSALTPPQFSQWVASGVAQWTEAVVASGAQVD